MNLKRGLKTIPWMGALLALWIAGCTPAGSPSQDPKKLLSEYISRSFAVSQSGDRARLVELLTGDARRRLEAWSEDQFREAFVEAKRQFVKLAYQEVKSVTADEVTITYELSYIDQARGSDAKVTQRKLARILRDPAQNTRWAIAEVRNLRELIEFRDELALP